MSGHDDQFLNEVLQCQKQLITLPGIVAIHIKLIMQHFVTLKSSHKHHNYKTHNQNPQPTL